MISVPYLVYAIDWLNIFDRLQQKEQGMGEGSVQWADLMSQVASGPESEFLNFWRSQVSIPRNRFIITLLYIMLSWSDQVRIQ